MTEIKEPKIKKNIVQNLSQIYLQGIADDIANAKQISSIFPNMSDVGDIRENILLKFLQSHLPLRCAVVKGGCVFDSNANESKQIDLLVVNDSSLRFSYFERDTQNSKNIQTIEGCLAAISVKSTLDKKELYNALENLSTIPKMPVNVLQGISHLISNRDNYLTFPLKIIFAFTTSLQPETILQHINNFYNSNNFQDYQKANLIIVNNFLCIERIEKGGGETRDGTILTEGSYYPVYWRETPKKKFGSLPLFRLLIRLHSTTQWTPHVSFNYNDYFNSIDFTS